jgi:hypothetical protein
MANMGIGQLGGTELVFKRKFRWTFSIEASCGIGNTHTIPEHFVKVAARPNINVEELEINFLNAKTWIPGKASWETITVTYYDVATADNLPLWDWLSSIYDFRNPVELHQASKRSNYAGVATLTLYDGCGSEIEVWKLHDVWPQAINFGELDYSSNDEVNIELTLRYSGVQYEPRCVPWTKKKCCDPCNPGMTGTGNFGLNPTSGA